MISSGVRFERRALWTLNSNPRKSVYGETLKKFNGSEYRRWDPNRSKLGAGLMRTNREKYLLLPEEGTTVLYLGAGHGTSISHLYDHLCGQDNELGGRLVAVDLASRCLRDLTHLAKPDLVLYLFLVMLANIRLGVYWFLEEWTGYSKMSHNQDK
jgi:fibrillarin-like rRNA methylase